MVNSGFWQGKRVFLTGHTGFKGSWLCLWLASLGAEVTGYALEPPTVPSLYESARVGELVTSITADVRDLDRLKGEMTKAAPEIVIHMAAQPLVRDSYKIPVETYAVNVMGTVNLLEAVRNCPSVRAVVNVTTDKVYENREWVWGYRENEPFGGYDPYSNSKACSELVTAAYRSSYFATQEFNSSTIQRHGAAVATARAGNVIGGGDWATDRLIPDIIRAILAGEPVRIRNPHAIRPWQHVLEPLSGYMVLAQRLYEDGARYGEGWNFGPAESDARPVEWLVKRLCERWGEGASYELDQGKHPHEARYLKLDCSKARAELGWQPRWSLEAALESIVAWTKMYRDGGDLRSACLAQIRAYSGEWC
ncbi:CDP-glucose 4,6-dehydratase [Geomobilimonas luticola]|uniref:CDP-glucose 4,6-dehydratase n=1 Tax=Geomobilimonas luticola TaxID=1114878 RepID=A0ABS5SEH9_9BACT|nr:CDP-glucose 4,6-dehydratase [Geomobilimonas luticola]MBT0653783.1 CDP-glucose 4,6-dehydratase [Geomobilimonas luticola]